MTASSSWSMSVRCLGALALAWGMGWGAAWGATNDFLPASGDWNSAANWSAGHVPVLSEDVTIGTGKTASVAVSGAPLALAARSLTVSGALQATSGTASDAIQLTLATGMTIAGELTVTGPTLTIDQESAADGTPGNPSVSAAIASGGTLRLGDDTHLNLDLGIHLLNNGTLILGSKATITYDGNPYSDFTQGVNGHLYWTLNANSLSAFLAPSSVDLDGSLHLLRPGTVTFSGGETIPLFEQVQTDISGDFATFIGGADFTNAYVAPSRSYAFTALGSSTITPVTVTIANQTRRFGEANPANTFSVSGLLPNDTAASLGTPIFEGAGVAAGPSTPAGDYAITLRFTAGNANYQIAPIAPGTLTILPLANLLPQTITFPALADLSLGNPTRALGASASSGLAIFYLSSDTSVATVDNATGQITAVAPGTVDITATQAGDANYAFAPSVTRRLLVIQPLAQTITFRFASGTTASLTVGTTLTLTATSDSGLPVRYASSDASIATISGGNVLTAIAVGTANVIAYQDGDATYAQAAPLPRTVTVTASATTSGATDPVTTETNCGAGGGVALLLGVLICGWRRRT